MNYPALQGGEVLPRKIKNCFRSLDFFKKMRHGKINDELQTEGKHPSLHLPTMACIVKKACGVCAGIKDFRMLIFRKESPQIQHQENMGKENGKQYF